MLEFLIKNEFMISKIIVGVVYSFLSLILIRAYWREDKITEGKRTLKSFYYGLFFPITMIYQHFFNGGSLE